MDRKKIIWKQWKLVGLVFVTIFVIIPAILTVFALIFYSPGPPLW